MNRHFFNVVMLSREQMRGLLVGITLAMGLVSAFASEESIVTAVYSKVRNGYTRQKNADGKYVREYYALANGTYAPGIAKDSSIDDLAFPAIAGTIASFLAKQNYFMAQNSKTASLLLTITWGTSVPLNPEINRQAITDLASVINRANLDKKFSNTAASSGGSKISSPAGSGDDLEMMVLQLLAANKMQERANADTARLLGYTEEYYGNDNISRFAGKGDYYDTIKSEIEEPRYYVVIQAYDFHTLQQEKKLKLLWETRVSIRALQSRFDKDLNAMIAEASKYFGQDSGKLIRQYHEGKVTLGETQIIGVVPPAEVPEKAKKK